MAMRKHYLSVLPAIMAAVALLASCNKEEGGDVMYMLPETKAMTLSSEQEQMVEDNNSFSLGLFEEAIKQTDGGKPVFISPMGVFFMLGMIQSGADDQVQSQTAKGMGFSGRTSEEINEWCHSILTQAPDIDKQVTFTVANALYVNKKYELQKNFTKDMQKYYEASIDEMDFSSSKTLTSINSWCSKHTEGMIPEILGEDVFSSDAVSYILNAVYFEAKWTRQFDKANTRNREFTTEDGTELSIPTMHNRALVNAFEGEDYSMVCLPYGSGSSWNMLVVLPAEGKTLEEVATSLKGSLSEAIHSLHEMELEIEIPKFSTNTTNDLKELLPALGISDMFAGGITGMCKGKDLLVSKMIQKAAIDVYEEGSKATAVTVAEMGDTSPGPSMAESGVFHADRPFIYLITENISGAIFFAGTYTGKR